MKVFSVSCTVCPLTMFLFQENFTLLVKVLCNFCFTMSLKDESVMENVCGNHSYRQELPDFFVEVFSGFILIINIYNTLLRRFIVL